DQIQTALKNGTDSERQQAFKYVLAILCATRAPSYYLKTSPSALEARIDFYLGQLANSGVISSDFAEGVRKAELQFVDRAPIRVPAGFWERKATNAIRTRLMSMLDVRNIYDLDRLNLTAQTTLNVSLQNSVLALFKDLKDPAFIASQGLKT